MFLFKKHSKSIFIGFILFIFAAGITLGILAGNTSDRRFEAYTQQFALKQLSQNTLNLHYTLAAPENYGITDTKPTLGRIPIDSDTYFASLENECKLLTSFPYQKLSPKNQLTYDILKLYYDTELSNENQYYLSEILSPTLGIQAQLPLLLAEYTFRTKQDIHDYFYLLKDIPSYFESIIAFEQQKSNIGTFMNDITANRIIKQCSTFCSSDKNYLQTIFEEQLNHISFLSEKEKQKCIALHQQLLNQYVIPAYKSLIGALTHLKGTGKNAFGLYYLDGGKEYYTYLIKSGCGIYQSIEELQTRLGNQLTADIREMHTLLENDPSLAGASLSAQLPNKLSADWIMQTLQEKIQKDFPNLPDVSYEIKYIHKDLQEYLSPAFYLTPPIDTKSPNMIYLNPESTLHGIELFTTLSHEGFPGHLYQTQFFMNSNTDLIRYLFSMSGYVEGWATYIESFAYEYGCTNKNLGRLLWVGRSMNLCIYSLLDIGIHYHGWTFEKAADFLSNFGITDSQICQEIFQCILEDPGNYLKYYGGCLQFIDLRDQAAAKEAFHLSDFHQRILEIGPCQFPILEQYLFR